MRKRSKRAQSIRPAGREKAAAGIDPARYGFQMALLTPSQTYYNHSFPLSARTAQDLATILPPSTPFIAEGFGTSGRLFFMELARLNYPCKELNPKLGRHLRLLEQEGHTDAGDAAAIAKAEFLFPNRLAPITLSESREALATLTKSRRRLVKGKTADKNRLHVLLSESYGALYKTLKAKISINTKHGRRFFHRFPSINALLASPEGEGELAFFFQKDAHALIRAEKPWTSTIYLEALEEEARLLLDHIEATEKMTEELKKKITTVLPSQKDAHLLLSIPGVGPISAATILSEMKTIDRFPSEAKFAGYCGLGQLVFQSGEQSSGFKKRTMYNRALKGAFFDVAFSAISKSGLARTYYCKKRQEGKTHRQALLRLARYYARIVYSVLKKQKTYQDIFPEQEVAL